MDSSLRRHDFDGYQAGGRSWDPFRPDVPDLLAEARHREARPIYYGSNHCFLVTVEADEAGTSLAVYKPARGEYPLYDFASGTLYRREVGSWLVSRLLGWQLVPPTVITQGKYGVGSLQLFIESEDQGEIPIQELRRLSLLDAVLNNADRKGEHCLIGEGGKLWGIDHGLTFHVQTKLRTVLWHFAGAAIRSDERADLAALFSSLESGSSDEARRLRELLSRGEWQALQDRVARLLDVGRFPDPRYKPVPYRW